MFWGLFCALEKANVLLLVCTYFLVYTFGQVANLQKTSAERSRFPLQKTSALQHNASLI